MGRNLRCTAPIALACLLLAAALDAAAVTGKAPAPSPASDRKARAENCQLARERQNDLAIRHWCGKAPRRPR